MSGVEDRCRGLANPSGACCCRSPRCLLPVLYASFPVSPTRSPSVGVSEVTRRSPDRRVILSISNHLPTPFHPSSLSDACRIDPPPHPMLGDGRFSEKDTEGKALSSHSLPFWQPFPSCTPPPFRILMNNSGKVRKGLEKPLACLTAVE